MASQPTSRNHIETTELLVRLYVFLSQNLDRCINEAAHQSYPESELKKHLAETRSKLSEILSVNRVGSEQGSKNATGVLSLGAACLKDAAGKAAAVESIKAERRYYGTKLLR